MHAHTQEKSCAAKNCKGTAINRISKNMRKYR
jgi:hypothetical protein